VLADQVELNDNLSLNPRRSSSPEDLAAKDVTLHERPETCPVLFGSHPAPVSSPKARAVPRTKPISLPLEEFQTLFQPADVIDFAGSAQ